MIQPPKIEFRGFDFKDRSGQWRTIYPCSVLEREYLRDRINQIWQFVQDYPDDTASFTELLKADKFMFLVKEALRLGGVEVDWLTPEYLQAMVLPYFNGEGEREMKPILVALNFPEVDTQKANVNAQGEPETFFDLLAALWQATQSLEEAINISSVLPMDELQKILEARAKIVEKANMSGKEKSKKSAKDYLLKDQDQVYAKLPKEHPMRKRWEKFRTRAK